MDVAACKIVTEPLPPHPLLGGYRFVRMGKDALKPVVGQLLMAFSYS
jgi:hypothetical protein